MEKRLQPLIIVLILMVLSISLYNLYKVSDVKKNFAYVDLNRLYAEINYTAEIKAKLEVIESARKNSLDSIRTLMMTESTNNSGSERNTELEDELKKSTEKFQNELTQYANFFDGQIWELINDQVNDFGKKHAYGLLLGTKGDGNIMYGDSLLNITQEVVIYINENRKGAKE